MGTFVNLTGRTFGMLTVLSQAPHIGTCVAWNCQCSCGNTKIVKGILLTLGKTTSCGCKCFSSAQEFREKYGCNVKEGIAKDEYSIYLGIKKRCNNKSSFGYSWYGGR